MRARDAINVEPVPEDARLLRQRYEALRERRVRIGEALPQRLQPHSTAPEGGLDRAGVVLPPRMDADEVNPDGLLFLPAVEDSTGGRR